MATSTEKSRVWRLANPERHRELQKQYRDRQRKGCKSCGLPRPFQKIYCDTCRVLKQKETQKYHRAKRFTTLATYKLSRGCEICGYSKCASALHFHHKDQTMKEHRVWVPEGPEFDKCMLVCANCHFEIHEGDKN